VCRADIDECDMFNNLCVNGECDNTMGYFQCTCAPGYKLDATGGNCTGTLHTLSLSLSLSLSASACLSLSVCLSVCITVLLFQFDNSYLRISVSVKCHVTYYRVRM